MGRQRLGDRAAHGVDQLGRLGICVRCSAAVGELCPSVVLERDFAFVPCAPADFHGGLEQRELVRPRAELAVSSKGVELSHDRHERVRCRLGREVLELARLAAGEVPPASFYLEARGAPIGAVQYENR